jgi:hypothetical protein
MPSQSIPQRHPKRLDSTVSLPRQEDARTAAGAAVSGTTASRRRWAHSPLMHSAFMTCMATSGNGCRTVTRLRVQNPLPTAGRRPRLRHVFVLPAVVDCTISPMLSAQPRAVACDQSIATAGVDFELLVLGSPLSWVDELESTNCHGMSQIEHHFLLCPRDARRVGTLG